MHTRRWWLKCARYWHCCFVRSGNGLDAFGWSARSDGSSQLGEGCHHPQCCGFLNPEFVVTPAEVLDERMSCTDHPCSAKLFEAAHRAVAGTSVGRDRLRSGCWCTARCGARRPGPAHGRPPEAQMHLPVVDRPRPGRPADKVVRLDLARVLRGGHSTSPSPSSSVRSWSRSARVAHRASLPPTCLLTSRMSSKYSATARMWLITATSRPAVA